METKTQNQNPIQTEKKQAQKIQKVNKPDYDEYCRLKFMKIDGAILNDQKEKEFQQLEKSILACDGKKPKISTTRSFGMSEIKLVKDVPVPEEVYEFVKNNAKDVKKYF